MAVTTDWIDEVRYGPGGGIYRVVVTPAQTGNTYFGVEATESPGGGPRLHIQTREEELFVVLEGEITFWLDGQVIKRSAGGTAFVPCGMPHVKPLANGSGAVERDAHRKGHRLGPGLRNGDTRTIAAAVIGRALLSTAGRRTASGKGGCHCDGGR